MYHWEWKAEDKKEKTFQFAETRFPKVSHVEYTFELSHTCKGFCSV